MWNVVLVSNSTRADITPEWLAKVAAAVDRQLKEHFCPDYGLAAWTCTTDTTQPGPRVSIWDTSDQAGAAGYHFVEPDGTPAGKVFAEGESLDAVSVTISHEVLELVGDLDTERFRLALDGVAYAEEACDAVEDVTYQIDGVTVSDYVLPDWYDAESPGPWDREGKLTSPLSKTIGGYTIQLRGAKVATDPPEMAATPKKAHPASRTARRLARAAAALAATCLALLGCDFLNPDPARGGACRDGDQLAEVCADAVTCCHPSRSERCAETGNMCVPVDPGPQFLRLADAGADR
jgi:hypothetical protein